jgi:hypothetical protein
MGGPVLAFLASTAGIITLSALWVGSGVVTGFIYAIHATAQAVEKKRQHEAFFEEFPLLDIRGVNQNNLGNALKDILRDEVTQGIIEVAIQRLEAKKLESQGPLIKVLDIILDKLHKLNKTSSLESEATFENLIKKLKKDAKKKPVLTTFRVLRLFRVIVSYIGTGTYVGRSLLGPYAPLALATGGILTLGVGVAFTMAIPSVAVIVMVAGTGVVWGGVMGYQYLRDRYLQKKEIHEKTDALVVQIKEDTFLQIPRLLAKEPLKEAKVVVDKPVSETKVNQKKELTVEKVKAGQARMASVLEIAKKEHPTQLSRLKSVFFTQMKSIPMLSKDTEELSSAEEKKKENDSQHSSSDEGKNIPEISCTT